MLSNRIGRKQTIMLTAVHIEVIYIKFAAIQVIITIVK